MRHRLTQDFVAALPVDGGDRIVFDALESGFGIRISVKMVVMAALGGAGQLFGPMVGALILVPLEELSNSYLGGRGAGLTFVVYGAIIVIIARFQPGGILALINRLWAKRKPAETPAAQGAPHAS